MRLHLAAIGRSFPVDNMELTPCLLHSAVAFRGLAARKPDRDPVKQQMLQLADQLDQIAQMKDTATLVIWVSAPFIKTFSFSTAVTAFRFDRSLCAYC